MTLARTIAYEISILFTSPSCLTTKDTTILTTGARRHGTSARRTPRKKRQAIAICEKSSSLMDEAYPITSPDVGRLRHDNSTEMDTLHRHEAYCNLSKIRYTSPNPIYQIGGFVFLDKPLCCCLYCRFAVLFSLTICGCMKTKQIDCRFAQLFNSIAHL